MGYNTNHPLFVGLYCDSIPSQDEAIRVDGDASLRHNSLRKEVYKTAALEPRCKSALCW
jgi:hypothetical protein